jgi:protein-tyrosine phosphatase
MQYNFAPACAGERIVFGAERPGFDFHHVDSEEVRRWISFVRQSGIERVCSLLSAEQLAFYAFDLLQEYRLAFGEPRVCSAPVPDGHLCERATLHGVVLPFLREADELGERVVVHCSGGSGRTGHILAAWLVHARGFTIDKALSAVRLPRRNPLEAVILGHASMEDLTGLLAGCSAGSAV